MSRYRVGFEIPLVLVAAAVSLFVAACGGTTPRNGASALLTTPSPATPAGSVGLTGGASGLLVQEVLTFTLANGTFTFRSEEGELTGTYSGVVDVPTEGRPKVTMSLEIDGGSDSFAGAEGTLAGDGRGALTVGGDFVLSVKGVVSTTAEPLGAKFNTTLKGTAALLETCSLDDHRISRLEGEGTAATVGKVYMELESEILETICFD